MDDYNVMIVTLARAAGENKDYTPGVAGVNPEQKLDPVNMLILAPNPLFLNFIAQVLPDLGVERVVQTTFPGLCARWMGKRTPKIISPLRQRTASIIRSRSKEIPVTPYSR